MSRNSRPSVMKTSTRGSPYGSSRMPSRTRRASDRSPRHRRATRRRRARSRRRCRCRRPRSARRGGLAPSVDTGGSRRAEFSPCLGAHHGLMRDAIHRNVLPALPRSPARASGSSSRGPRGPRVERPDREQQQQSEQQRELQDRPSFVEEDHEGDHDHRTPRERRRSEE